MDSDHLQRTCVAACLLVLTFCSSSPAQTSGDATDLPSIAGDWSVRIEAGGEIYKAKFRVETRDGELAGTYESDEGRRTRLTSVSRRGDQVRIETRTQRFSVPVTAVFIGELKEGEIRGEVDFASGSRSRSYDFVAKLDRPAANRIGLQASGSLSVELSSEKQMSLEVDQSDKRNRVARYGEGQSHRDWEPPALMRRSSRVSFQQGVGNYTSMVDVEVWAIAPDKPLSRQGTLTSDGNNGGGESQVLMQFRGIFGADDGQIPRRSRIRAARLKVVAFDPGTTVYVHRVLVPWSAAATWNSLAAGLTIDNLEASTVRDGFTFGQINMDQQSVEFDVTQTVQHWSDGEPNYGWVFVNTGSNGWDFYSADWHEIELRPKLTVEYELRSEASAQTDAAVAR